MSSQRPTRPPPKPSARFLLSFGPSSTRMRDAAGRLRALIQGRLEALVARALDEIERPAIELMTQLADVVYIEGKKAAATRYQALVAGYLAAVGAKTTGVDPAAVAEATAKLGAGLTLAEVILLCQELKLPLAMIEPEA